MNEAFGRPGERPTWTTGAKSGVGTAASPESLVWFTFSQGIMNEVYYPQVDTANIKDAQFVVAGDGFFSEEKSGTRHKMERLDLWAPAFRITNTCLSGRYEITKDVITDPSRNTLIQQVRFIPLEGKLADYSLFALTSPHIGNQGYHNDARIGEYRGNPMLLASSGSITLAVMCSSGFSKRSVGYAGTSGGWQDIAANYRMTNEFDSAPNGNVVLTGQIDLPEDGAFTLVFGFGKTEEEAAGQAYATIEAGYENCYTAYVDQWKKRTEPIRNLSACTGDDGALFRSSVQVLLSHQDKLHPGGTIA
ncbi:hypothetical protein K0U00_22625, partial [Paenibacillus sepulcri]|nr:hypothetical protein [Paenibacillus sepulcri]